MVHVKPKRPIQPVPFLQNTINDLVQAQSCEQLKPLLERFDGPHYFESPEERNLINWYRVLNRFDELLERYVDSRNIFSSPSTATSPTSNSASPTTISNLPTETLKTSLPTYQSNSNQSATAEAPSAQVTTGTSPAVGLAVASSSVSALTQSPAITQAATALINQTAAPIFTPTSYVVLLILRSIQRLVRNSSHDTRHVFNSIEHLGALLADPNSAIVMLSLDVLSLLLQRTTKFRSVRVGMTVELYERLADLATSYGGRENGLSLLDCCSSKSATSLSVEGARVNFEYTCCNSIAQNHQPQAPQSQVQQQQASQPQQQSQSAAPNNSVDAEHPVSNGETNGPDVSQNDATVSVQAVPPHQISQHTVSAVAALVGSHGVNHRKIFQDASASRHSGPIPLSPAGPNSHSPPSELPTFKITRNQGVITMTDAGKMDADEHWLLTDFAQNCFVPKSNRFSLLAAYRRARNFSLGREARFETAVIRLSAITVLFQLQHMQSTAQEQLTKEPELLQDIVALARADTVDGVGDIPRCLRNVAIRCITAMASDRQRASSIMAVTGVNQLHGALPTLLRTEVSALMDSKSSSIHESGLVNSPMDTSPDSHNGIAAETSAMKNSSQGSLSLLSECSRVPELTQLISTTETILTLVHGLAITTGSSGATPLANSGVLGILIPLLSDTDPEHARVVSQAIRTMQSIVEVPVQTVGCQIFRDQDGLTLVANRICAEIGIEEEVPEDNEEENDEAIEVAALERRGESRAFYDRLSKQQMSLVEAIETQPPSSFATFRGHLPHSKWSLLRALHQLLLAALGSGGNEVRELVGNSQFPRALRKMLAQPFHHGGCLFQAAATVTTDIAHAEPTLTAELVKAGIATAVLRTIKLGLPPCGEAVRCIPNLLAALCLANAAKDVIVKSAPLEPYLLRLATPFYTRALHGEIPIHIGNAVDELMRHVEALRPDGNEAMLQYLRMSMMFVTENIAKLPKTGIRRGTPNSNTKSVVIQYSHKGEKSSDKPSDNIDSSKPISGDGQARPLDVVLIHKMKLAVANNSSRLAGFSQGSSENQDAIANGDGLKYMVALRLAPALACAEATVKDNGSFSRHYPTPATTVVSLSTCLRNLSGRHGASVFKELFSSVLQDASKALKIADQLGNMWLPEEESDKESNVLASPGPSNDGEASSGEDINSKSVDEGDSKPVDRSHLRIQMADAVASLRVGVVLLSALSRGGLGNSAGAAGAWENSGGSQFAAVIAAVERAARFHLAKVYAGLTLSAASDGDLSTARVTAATDPSPKVLNHQDVSRHLGDVDRYLGYQISKTKSFEEACKGKKILQGGAEPARQDVKGLAWHLVTFVVAAQRLYSTLSRGLSLSFRRHSTRDISRYAASARSLAATIGRIFALHLKAASSLWDEKVKTMGGGRVTAAWDYVRGILIEMKGALFDEQRSSTQGLVLRSFLEAGGGEALLEATRPGVLLESASSSRDTSPGSVAGDERAHIDECVQQDSLTACAYLVALGEAYDHQVFTKSPWGTFRVDGKVEDAMSIDSVSHQARGISRIVVSESDLASRETPSSEDPFRKLVTNSNYLKSLKAQIEETSKLAMEYSYEIAVRRVASDAWSTICRFLYLLAACPGLINPNISPTSALTSPGDWGPRDVPRSAQTFVLLILRDVIKSPENLLAVYNPDWSGVTDIIGIAQATANTFRVLSHTGTRPDAPPGNFEHWDDLVEPREPTPSRPLSPDPNLVRNLVEMGFPERRARMALRNTAGGIEHAMEWLLSHPEEEERSDGSDAEGQRDWEGNPGTQNNEGESPDAERDENGEEDDEDDAERDEDDGDVDGDADIDADEIEDDERVDDDGDIDDEHEQEDDDGIELSNDDSDMEDDDDENDNDDGQNDDGVVAQDQTMSDTPDEDPLPGFNGNNSRMRQLQSLFGIMQNTTQANEDNSGPKSESSKLPVTTYYLQTDGKTLLEQSVSAELDLLSEALRRDPILASFRVQNICCAAAKQMGASYIASNKKSKQIKGATVVNPTSVETFVDSKKEMFQSLSTFTKVVITEAGNFPHEAHLPYVAIDMLRILQKDRDVSSTGDKEFAELLCEGLNLLLQRGESGAYDPPVAKGQTSSMWAHFGGQRARQTLQEVGVFSLASTFFETSVDMWERDLSEPLDKEASGSIEKLRISERASNRRLSRYMQEEASGEGGSLSRSRSGRIRLLVPTQHDVVKLGQLCTCMLALDAHVRYADKDRTVKQAEKLYGAAEKADGKAPTERKNRMETEDNGFDSDEPFPRDSLGQAIAGASGASPTVENMRSGVGEDSIQPEKDTGNVKDMDVDTKGIAEMEVELEVLRAEAVVKREELTDLALGEIAEMTDRPGIAGEEDCTVRVKLMKYCVRLLRIMKNLEAGDALLALMQLLTSLTHEWAVAKVAIEEGLIELLLSLAHLEARLARSVNSHMVRMLTKTILRHLIEDPLTLKEAMVVEMRGVISSGPTRARPTFPLKNLVGSTAPLAARDLGCFVKAIGESVTSAGERHGHVELRSFKPMTMDEARRELETRENVTRVVGALCALLPGRGAHVAGSAEMNGTGSRGHGSRRGDQGHDMQKFALESLGELVEVSQMVAVSLMNTRSPSSDIGGSAVDFVVQTLLPSTIENGDAKLGGKDNQDAAGVCEGARKLFSSLCSKNAMVHEEAVGALAKAVAMESNKEKASAGFIEGAAMCLSHGVKTRVLRAALKTELPNDLARSMKKLDVDGNDAAVVKGHVLRALSTLGQAGTQVGGGESGMEEVAFMGEGREGGWNTLREPHLPIIAA